MNNMSEDTDIVKKQGEIRQQLINRYIEYRKEKNLTQEELANIMGIKRPNISRFETGQCNPTLDLLVKMAESMDLELKIELIHRKESIDE